MPDPNRRSVLAALAATGCAAAPNGVTAQGVGPLGPPGAPAGAFPAPDRPVAEIVSPIWATERERDAVDEVGQIVRALDIRPGMTVADVGAGSGYHTVRLSRIVGPEGRVIANDVMPDYLAGLARRVAEMRLPNVALTLGEPHDPRLPENSTDVAILVHMYHEIAQPYAFLHNLVPALRPGARVGIVDLDRVTWQHGTPRALLRCELEGAGYRFIGFTELRGNLGYLATFSAPSAAGRPAPDSIRPCRVQEVPRGRR
ncbi:class I SAM-dependent methyltransferase [Roseomonas sp. CCTCC AB2023176]|uniref:class I SAM-dependent methyltransferase n=1 Tax=Roseomonas sp. CCTCC AB2023176 TaxID=3342640 RepID=UPI0035D9DC04